MTRPIYFMHVAKTGGVSLYSTLEDRFAPTETAPWYLTNQLAAALEQDPRALDPYRFVRGHLGYAPITRMSDPPLTLTMLRDPVERTLSHFDHIIRHPNHWVFHGRLAPDPSLEQFLDLDLARNAMTNHQVRNIAQDFDLTAPILNRRGEVLNPNLGWLLANCLPEEDGDALLERATARMDDFAFVGLTERFAQSLQLLDATMGWERPTEELMLNTAAASRIRAEDISDEARQIITECTALDRKLYALAEARLESGLQALSGQV